MESNKKNQEAPKISTYKQSNNTSWQIDKRANCFILLKDEESIKNNLTK